MLNLRLASVLCSVGIPAPDRVAHQPRGQTPDQEHLVPRSQVCRDRVAPRDGRGKAKEGEELEKREIKNYTHIYLGISRVKMYFTALLTIWEERKEYEKMSDDKY